MTHEELARLLKGSGSANPELDCLEERELEVVSMLGQGLTSTQICAEMGVDVHELTTLKKRLQNRLGLRSEVELLQFSARQR